jgi:hypothetical protein
LFLHDVVEEENVDFFEEADGLLRASGGLLFVAAGLLLETDGLFSFADGLLRASVAFFVLAVGLLLQSDVEKSFHVVLLELHDVFFEEDGGLSKQAVVSLEQPDGLLGSVVARPDRTGRPLDFLHQGKRRTRKSPRDFFRAPVGFFVLP